MARRYTGPKREDGRLLYASGTHGEYRGYIRTDEADDDAHAPVEVWWFLPGHETGERIAGLGPRVWAGLRDWSRDLDRQERENGDRL